MSYLRQILYAAAATIFIFASAASSRADDDPAALQPPPGTTPAELGLAELQDDPTPTELFQQVVAAAQSEDPKGFAQATQMFSLYGPFSFPSDALVDITTRKPRTNAMFGADISHYTNPAFPLESLSTRHVDYLYIKASQGQGVDGSFSRFWARAGRLPKGGQIFRGAYHFLTCGDPSIPAEEWGKSQADTFVKIIKASGGLRSSDLPPALDLEWDRTKSSPDRWTCRSAPQIIATARAFAGEIEAQLQRKPVLYTARAWWRGRIGKESAFSAFSDYPLWIADYSKSSRASEAPKSINDAPLALWQFTDSAKLALGFNAGFDANVFKGTRADFLKALNTADFE